MSNKDLMKKSEFKNRITMVLLSVALGVSSFIGYKKISDEKQQRNQIIEENLLLDPSKTVKTIYINEYNKENGTSFTVKNVSFDYSKKGPGGEPFELKTFPYIMYDFCKVKWLDEDESTDKHYMLSAYICDTDYSKIEKTAILLSGNYNIYTYEEHITQGDVKEFVSTKYANLIRYSKQLEDAKSKKEEQKAEKGLKKELLKYFVNIDNDNLEIIAQGIKEKGIIIDPSTYWKEDIELDSFVSDQDVDESINNEWKEELKVIEPVYYSKDDQETTEKYIDIENDNYKE